MRDPKRIEPTIAALRAAWERSPDLRLGQIVVNAARNAELPRDLFYVEDDAMHVALLAAKPFGTAPAECDRRALVEENARLRRALTDRARIDVGWPRMPPWWPQLLAWAQREEARKHAEGPEFDASAASLDGEPWARVARLEIRDEEGRRMIVPIVADAVMHLNAMIDVTEAKR